MSESKFNLEDYVQVNDRIIEFYKKYPNGSIQTEIISNQDGQVIIKAYAYRTPDDPRPCTGHAMEKEGSTYINKTSHIENCETSAVGRALAMMGFEIKKSIASREEVQNARNNQEQHKEEKAGNKEERYKCADCGKEITKAVKTFSEKLYNKALCVECQQKYKKVEGK